MWALILDLLLLVMGIPLVVLILIGFMNMMIYKFMKGTTINDDLLSLIFVIVIIFGGIIFVIVILIPDIITYYKTFI